MARMRVAARSTSFGHGSNNGNSDSLWFGVALGIVAFLILTCACCIEDRRYVVKRQKKAKEAQKRKEAAVKELEMQADLFVKAHLEPEP